MPQDLAFDQAEYNVDVPVYRVELETRVSAQDDNSDIFAVGSSINASLKFYPARSAYQYSHDGTDGGEVLYKNTYFMTAFGTDENITQQGHTNVFATNRIGTSTIVGYVFASAGVVMIILMLLLHPISVINKRFTTPYLNEYGKNSLE